MHRLFDPLLVQAATRGAGLDWKTSLQELAASRGQEALTLVTLYKSLGGGWEPWMNRSVISDETASQMSARTRWGDLLAENEQRNIAQAASTGTEHDRGWWRWRWWRPQW